MLNEALPPSQRAWEETPDGDVIVPAGEPQVSYRQLHANRAELEAEHSDIAGNPTESRPIPQAIADARAQLRPSSGNSQSGRDEITRQRDAQDARNIFRR